MKKALNETFPLWVQTTGANCESSISCPAPYLQAVYQMVNNLLCWTHICKVDYDPLHMSLIAAYCRIKQMDQPDTVSERH